MLANPWGHDAEGVEIQYKFSRGVQDGGFTEYLWPLWRHKDALLKGDSAAATAARADFRAIDAERRATQDWWIPGNGYCEIVWREVDAGNLDAAAAELLHWYGVSIAKDVENDNSRRTNCRQLIECTIRFFNKPGAAGHPQSSALRAACLALAAEVYPVLNVDLQAGVTRLSRA